LLLLFLSDRKTEKYTLEVFEDKDDAFSSDCQLLSNKDSPTHTES